jgi:hypothetical protein
VSGQRFVVIQPVGCDPVRLTDAEQRGLMVVHRHNGRASVSNVTSGRRVYWQAANRLRDRGLIEFTVAGSHGADGLALTPLGTRVAYTLEAGA